MIGIVSPSFAFGHELQHFNEKESIFNQYRLLAKKYQVDLCMFSFRQISKNLKIADALVYSHTEDSLIRKTVAAPRVNIVRNTKYVMEQRQIRKFEALRNQQIHFINFPLYSQANKLQNYEHLTSHDQFKNHVPPTKRLSFEHLDVFIREHGKVIIKPIFGSKGRGITVIENDRVQYQVCQTPSGDNVYTHSRLNSQKKFSIPHSELKRFYNKNFGNPSSFLVQQWISFNEYNGSPFDIRAVVQKNGKNKWQLTSCVARVANEHGEITNLNQGGKMVSLSKLQLQRSDIREFCLEIAKPFAKLYPWTAEMGIDLGIDKEGKLWFIETNYCPEKRRWATIFKTPFEYAYYLYKRDLKTFNQ